MVSLPNTESSHNTNAGASPPSLDEIIAALRAVIHRQKGAVYHRGVGMGKEEAEEHAALRAALRVLEGCRRWVSYMETDESEPSVDLYRILTGLPELPSPPATTSEGEPHG